MVAGGLLAGLRGGGASTTPPAAPSAVRATLDPVTSLTGDATQVSELQNRLSLHPANARLQGDLGIAYLQRARETNDPSYYTKAHTLLNRSLKRDPGGLDATIGEGSLALSYHDFREALQLGKRALVLSHGFSPPALAMIGDASVELGRYKQGFAAFAQLGKLRPGLVAYARLSYSRELQGDVAGATRLMRRAVDAGSGAPENTQWTRVQLAALLLKSGHTDAAAKEYHHALALLPNYARAEAGLGAVAVARGNLALAQKWYERAASHLPLPDIVAQLGDVREARGDKAGAKEAYTLVGVENALFIRAGGNADLETALFDASHPGMISRPPVVALARKALAFRPSIYGHDALAWALYAAGKCRQALPQASSRTASARSTRSSRGTSARSRPAPASATLRARR